MALELKLSLAFVTHNKGDLDASTPKRIRLSCSHPISCSTWQLDDQPPSHLESCHLSLRSSQHLLCVLLAQFRCLDMPLVYHG